MPLHIDLHVHTYFSGDGVSSPEEMVATARRKGLHGIAITDHNTCEAVDYLTALGMINPEGTPVDGFLIIPGVEVSTAEGHLLCIGTTLPDFKDRPALEVCHEIHARGGLAIPAHPYDLFRAGIREATLDTLPMDALEVFNAATTFKRYNERAAAYAARRDLPATAGSDAHHESAVGTAYTTLETDDFTVAGVLQQITVRNNPLNQTYLTTRDAFRKTWNNWLRLRRRRPEHWPGK
ncbi:MAG TPA: CehA/McbA family metallohydrolase [Chthoniobacteraceae bacterium]|nr:CehA/McbA family metallohydrolase [Chthoniobacteraceae bacterium]